MKTYFQNGTAGDIELCSDCIENFCVHKMPKPSIEKYTYTGDSIKYELDTE